MKPVTNLDELNNFTHMDDGAFASSFAPISENIGAKNLGYSLAVVPPGKRVCPFHNHHVVEEMFFILEGEGILRFGDKEYPLRKNDIIACPPGGRDVAHQIVNTSDKDITYLCVSTMEEADVCEYPDSDKVFAMVGPQGKRTFKHLSFASSAVDYFDGEKK